MKRCFTTFAATAVGHYMLGNRCAIQVLLSPERVSHYSQSHMPQSSLAHNAAVQRHSMHGWCLTGQVGGENPPVHAL